MYPRSLEQTFLKTLSLHVLITSPIFTSKSLKAVPTKTTILEEKKLNLKSLKTLFLQNSYSYTYSPRVLDKIFLKSLKKNL